MWFWTAQFLRTYLSQKGDGTFGVLDPGHRVVISGMDSHICLQILFVISVCGPKPLGIVNVSTSSMRVGEAARPQKHEYFP